MLTHVVARITLVIPLTNQSQPGHLAVGAGGSTLILTERLRTLGSTLLVEEMKGSR